MLSLANKHLRFEHYSYMKRLEKSNKYQTIFCLILPFIISIVVYLNCLSNSFVYDDESTIINNYFIRHWSNFPYIFTSKYFSLSAELTYRPVVTVSYFIDYTFWHLNSSGYHLTNVLLHAINSILVFIFTFLLLRKRLLALIASVFFSSYPIFSEAVNAIGFREDLLAFMFFILAFICYLKANQLKFIPYYPLSLCCFLLSLFSKEMTITLPVLILLSDIILRGLPSNNANDTASSPNKNKKGNIIQYLRPRILHYYTGYFLITIFYILIRFFFLHNPLESKVNAYPQDSLLTNLFTMIHVLSSYIKLVFLPFSLNTDYTVPFSNSPIKLSSLLSILLFIVTGIISFRMWLKNKIIFFFIIWCFVTLIPVMNIFPLSNIMAERYLYIPCAGFSIFIAILLSKKMSPSYSLCLKRDAYVHASSMDINSKNSSLYTSFINPFTISILSCILAGNAYLTFSRNSDWKDGLRLWAKTVKTSPDSIRAHINLGNAYENRGLNSEAIEEYKRALGINPNDADIYNNLGICYDNMNMLEDATSYFLECIDINPRHKRVYNNLGVVFVKQRRLDEAINSFNQAISINPLFPDAYCNLGIAYYRKGLLNEAERSFKKALNMEYYHAKAHNALGILYNNKGIYDDSIKEFEIALRIKPDYANAHMNLGVTLLKHRNDKKGALFHLKESIRIESHQEQANGIKKLIKQLEQAN